MHLYLDHAVALACLASTTFDVERESARFVTPGTCLLCSGKEFTDGSEQAGVGGGIRAGGAANGALVNVDDLVQVVQSFERLVGGMVEAGGLVEFGGSYRIQGAVDQRGLARPGYTGDAGHDAQGQIERNVFQVVASST